ncbi:hypothetical protein [Acidovorax sp.]|uniref:hypothetical protein n=1 Tax=Acidovorax sp. TaxID=1872122 RepID=UPI0031DE5430
MAGDWIKMRVNLATHPKVLAIAEHLASCDEYQDWSTMAGFVPSLGGTRADYERDFTASLRVTRYVTVCALLRFWGYANEHARDEFIATLRVSDVDEIVQVPGFGEALASVGWALFDDERRGLHLPGFNEFNTSGHERSASAKSNAERQRDYRARLKTQDSNAPSCNESDVTRNRREEKRREEKKEDKEDTAPRKRVTPPKPDDIDQQVWDDWLSLRKAKRAPVSLTVLEDARRESSKAGMSLENFLRIWCRRGSQGLEAAWLKPDERSTGETAYQRSMRERVEEMSPSVARKAPGMAYDRATQILDCVIVEAEPLAIGGAHG